MTRARGEQLQAAGIGAVVLAVYAATVHVGIPGGDAGELVVAAASGGVAHPPGYPLYLLLGRFWALLPLGPLALKFNLLSALAAAAAAGTLFFGLRRLSGSPLAALVGTSCFAFSAEVWREATGAEVFALNDLFLALLLSLAICFHEDRNRRWAVLGAFLLGLGCANHQTLLFAAAPLVLWMLIQDPGLLRGRWPAMLLGAVACGLLPYVYLVVAGGHASPVSWGDTTNWEGFWTHVLRREYGTLRLSVGGSAPHPVDSAWLFIKAASLGLGLTGLPALLYGVVFGLRERTQRATVAALLGGLLLPLAIFCALGNLPLGDALHREILARFWPEPFLFACALAALGVAAIASRLPRFARIALAPIALLPLIFHFHTQDHGHGRIAESYGREILRAAPRDALLVTRGDLTTNTIRYLQYAEAFRSDVHVVDAELFAFPWQRRRLAELDPALVGANDGGSLADLVAANLPHRPVELCGDAEDADPAIPARFALWPLGLCKEVGPAGASVDIQSWIADSDAAVPHIDCDSEPTPEGSWEAIACGDRFVARERRALQLLEIAGKDPQRRGYIELAAQILASIAADDPRPAPSMLKALAISYGRLGTDTAADKARTAKAWRAYLAVAPADDGSLAAIRAEADRLER